MAACVGFVPAGIVWAQNDSQPVQDATKPAYRLSDPFADVHFTLESHFVATTDDDLDTAGSASVVRIGPEIRVRYAPEKTSHFDLLFGSEFSFYDFSGATAIVPGGDPAGDVSRSWIGAQYAAQLSGDWWWFVDGRATWAFESGASVGDALIGSGTVGATYALNDNLTLGLGLHVRSRLEDNAQVYPLPYINWTINEQWSLASTQTGARLSYVPFDDWTFFLEGGWESREYRLDDNGPIPGGVMRDDRVPLSLGATWQANEHFDIAAAVGSSLSSQYEFLNANGNQIANPNFDAGLAGTLTLTVHF